MTVKNIWGNNPKEVFLRKAVMIDELPKKAFARIFADTGYELFINGRLVAKLDEWCNTRDYNVTLFVKEGMNNISIHGINHGGHRGVAFELAVNGKTVAVSDKSWKCEDHERWGWTQAEYDETNTYCAKELDTSAAGALQWWTKPGSDADRIVPALDCSQFFKGEIPKTCASPYWNAEKIEYEPEKRVLDIIGDEYAEHLKPHLPKIQNYSSILYNSAEEYDGKIYINGTQRYTGPSFVVDIGAETVGHFRMRIRSDNSVSFRIHYGETLDQAMSEPPRDQNLYRMLCEEYRIFSGEQEFESRMRVAFRYVRIEFFDCDDVVTAEAFCVKTTLYPVARRGYFASDDADMTRLWEMGERTLHFCMQEYYLDAPMRDRFLWTGDARMEALINYYTFADTKLFEFCWEELAKTQMPCGGIPASYGEGNSMLWDYVAFYVIAFYDYYMYTGNKEFLLRHKEVIEKTVGYLISLTNEQRVIDVPDNPLGNLWMVELDEFSGIDPYLNELYLRAVKTAQLIEKLAGDNEREAFYKNLANSLQPRVAELLSNDNMLKCFDNTFHTQMQYEMAEMDLNNGNIERMIERIKRYWICMISSGSDCLHENTDKTGILPRIDEYSGKAEFASYCHAWTGAATVLLPMGIAGIKPVEPGYKKVRIQPEFSVFASFKCVVPTPLGEIAVKYKGGEFSYTVPKGIETEVIVNGKIFTDNSGKICVN